MYPPKFDYYRASTVNEAVTLMQQHPGARFLAGGHSLLPVMKLRLADPGTLIDIGRIDGLRGIKPLRDGGFEIGALTPHAEVAAATDLPRALTEAAGWIGDPQVRNRGTVGGNIAHADPASDLPTVLTALGALINIAGPNGERQVAAKDFFIDMFITDLAENEIVTSVRIVPSAAVTGSAYTKLFNPASRYAMVGAAAVITMGNGRCQAASVAIGGLTSKATLLPAVAAALVGNPVDDDLIAGAAERVLDNLDADDILGDIHASADYRRAMAPVFVQRALAKAVERAV